MPDISQHEYDYLQKRLKGQQAAIERKSNELKAVQEAASKAEAARLKAEADLQRMTDENPFKVENEKLRGTIRDGKHRTEFAKVAKEKGATDDVIESIWKLVGYEAKGDEPDPAAIGAMLDEAKARPGIDRLFAPPAQPNGTPLPKPGHSNGQGGRLDAPSPYTMSVADDDGRLQDAAWQYKNFDRIAEAAQGRIDRGEI